MEIQTALPTFEQKEIPTCIKNIFVNVDWETVPEIRKTNILYQFPNDIITKIGDKQKKTTPRGDNNEKNKFNSKKDISCEHETF